MNKSTFDSDPVTDFVLGRDGVRLALPGALALTFVACLVIAALVAMGVHSGDVAFGAFVVVVVVVSWFSAPATAAAVALMGFLFANGFAFDSAGTLSWHGESDLLRLLLLIMVAITVSVLGHWQLDHVRRRSLERP